MCAIVGYSGNWNKEIVCSVMEESRCRGLHAFGYAFVKGKKVICKKFHKFSEFLDSVCADKPKQFIAHFRYSTSGDYKDHKNNQPVQLGDTALAFNGVIDMGTKAEMESRHLVKLASSNDGEIALIRWKQNKIESLLKNCTFAGVFISAAGIDVVRNSLRPAYLGVKGNHKFICSTADILKRAGIKELQPIPAMYRFKL